MAGTYYLVRNAVVIPGVTLGGWLYAQRPGVATAVDLVGVGYFALFGRESEAYAGGS